MKGTARKFSGRKTLARVSHPLSTRDFNMEMAKRMSLAGAEGKIRFERIVVKRNGRSRTLLLAVKRFFRNNPPEEGFNTVEQQFEILNRIREVPELKSHVPPTVRLLTHQGRTHLLLTDLTSGGKYIVEKYPTGLVNADEMLTEEQRLHGILQENGFYAQSLDACLFQVDPQTRTGLKVWIVDAGLIKMPKRRN